ncbi:MAG: 1-phosphofructokinase [Spirochaetaceae bacterium]|nr:MAG: 1-phosphofructokinase [Spirochaetaceae bacterium]
MILTVTINPAIDETVEIPSFAAGSVNRVASIFRSPGGKGINVASALADYGVEVSTTGFLGEDNDQLFKSHFSQKGIQDRFVRVSGLTRTGIKIIDPVDGLTTDINYPGLTPTAAEIEQLFERVRETGKTADWAVLTGSLPPGVRVTVYAELIELLHGLGCKVALDTSGEPLRAAMASVPDLIKPNIHELEEFAGRSLASLAEISQEAGKLTAQGVAIVAVSMGERGALIQDGTSAEIIHPLKVEVKSTVGAGDAMVAGILAGLSRGMSIAEAGRLGAAFSSTALSHTGPGIPGRKMVDDTLRMVRTESLSTE